MSERLRVHLIWNGRFYRAGTLVNRDELPQEFRKERYFERGMPSDTAEADEQPGPREVSRPPKQVRPLKRPNYPQMR